MSFAQILSLAIGLVALGLYASLLRQLRDWRLLVVGVLGVVLLVDVAISPARWATVPAAVLALLGMAYVSRLFGAQRRALSALEKERAHLEELFEGAPEAIVLVDTDDRVQRINGEFTRLFGYTAEEAVGRLINDLIAPPNLHQEALALTRRAAQGERVSLETVRRRKDGSLVHVSILGTPIRYNGGLVAVYGMYRDISDRMAAEEQLLHLAIRDELTGLANRALFRDLVARSIGRGKRREDYAYAVLVLDIDRFKLVNESLGHAAGDQLLRLISRRLERCVRPGDTVARLGGDEFALFLDDVRDVGDAIRVADRIQRELRYAFHIGQQEVFVSASVGITLSSSSYERPEDFLRDADLAMYRAKELGGARHEVFEAHMHQHAVAMLELETDLRRAMEREEFELHYQPIVEIATGEVVGFEALVRWMHPHKGLVLPASFVPLAEDTGLIVPLGQWVLREACRQLTEWRRGGDGGRGLTVSVNLSGKQLLQPDLVEQISAVLEETGIDPWDLRLEITESVVVGNAQQAVAMLGRLRALRVQIHMDDFGTGYSSLSYLHRFQVDTLKIDRSFVSAMGERGENSEIVRTIVSLARSLGIKVIAEGVETAEQLALLRALGCEHVQGYYFARPMTGQEALALLAAGRRA